MFSHWNGCGIGIVVHNGSSTREISFDRIMFAVKHNSQCNRRKFIEEIQKVKIENLKAYTLYTHI